MMKHPSYAFCQHFFNLVMYEAARDRAPHAAMDDPGENFFAAVRQTVKWNTLTLTSIPIA